MLNNSRVQIIANFKVLKNFSFSKGYLYVISVIIVLSEIKGGIVKINGKG